MSKRHWTIHVVDTRKMAVREFRLVDGPWLQRWEIGLISDTFGDDPRIKSYQVRMLSVTVELHDSNLWVCNDIVTAFVHETLGTPIQAAA